MTTRSFLGRLLGGAAVAACLLPASVAWAQGLDPFAAPPASPAPDRGIPTRDAENYEPFGARVGTFKLFPELEVGGAYSSNIFATQNNEVDDFIFTARPKLDLVSDWTSHYLKFTVGGLVGRYADNSNENFIDYGASAQGRFDLLSLGQSNLFARLAYDRLHEDRGSPNAVNGIDPTEYDRLYGQGGFLYKPGRFSAALVADATGYNFDDVARSTGAVINNDDRDRAEFTQSLRLGYEFSPGYEGFVRGKLRQVRYDTTPDDAGFNRNSSGYEAVGGLKFEISRITDVEVYGGYINADYDDARLSSVDGFTFGGAVNWSPIRPVRLTAYADRTIQETTDASFSGYLATTFGLQASYEFRPNVLVNGRLSYSMNEYERVTTFAGAEREDDIIEAEVGVKYLFTRNYYVNPSYRYTNRDSNVAGSDYDRSLVWLKLGARY